jgi:hypothetical protein
MDRMQGAGALGAEIVDQDAISSDRAKAFSERMLVEIGQKPESIRGGLGLAEFGEVLCIAGLLLRSPCAIPQAYIYPSSLSIPQVSIYT